MLNETMFSHNSSEWRTPLELFATLDAEFGFELDAAATEENALCSSYYSKEEDALAPDNNWYTFGSVFVNPPYGRDLIKWCKKAWNESQKGCTVVMLLPARTDTKWFHEYVLGKAEIRFLRGRIRFNSPNGELLTSAPFPSIVAVYRPPIRRSFRF